MYRISNRYFFRRCPFFFFFNVLVLNEILKLFKLYFIFPNRKTCILTIIVRFEIYYFQWDEQKYFWTLHSLSAITGINRRSFFFFFTWTYISSYALFVGVNFGCMQTHLVQFRSKEREKYTFHSNFLLKPTWKHTHFCSGLLDTDEPAMAPLPHVQPQARLNTCPVDIYKGRSVKSGCL